MSCPTIVIVTQMKFIHRICHEIVIVLHSCDKGLNIFVLVVVVVVVFVLLIVVTLFDNMLGGRFLRRLLSIFLLLNKSVG